jgi:septum site-determining protein MinD
MHKVLAVFSGKGGVGKTTIAINIALALNNLGRNVILLDGDIKKPNICSYLDHPESSGTFHDVLEGKKKINEVVSIHSSGLKYIPGDKSYLRMEKDLMKNFEKNILNGIKSEELIILDTPSGFHKDCEKCLSHSDYSVIVTTPDLASVSDAAKAIRMAEKIGSRVIGVIVNKRKNVSGEMLDTEIETVLGKKVLEDINDDVAFVESMHATAPVIHSHPGAIVTDQFQSIAYQLLGEKYEKKVMKADQSNMFDYILKRLGLK